MPSYGADGYGVGGYGTTSSTPSMTVHSRWFVLPVATDDDGNRYPKYTARVGVKGHSSNVIDFADSDWSDVPLHAELYLSRVYGDTTTLDGIASEPDVRAIDAFGTASDVVRDWLNRRFSQSRTYTEWQAGFRRGGA